MKIVQPTIHTKLTVTYASGRVKVIYLPYEMKGIPVGPFVDRWGVEHYINNELVENIEKSYINSEVE